jgi:hypothetical protein
VLACYFPITYSPPAGGGADVIGREELVAGVAGALAAAPAFAPHAMPLVLEKLGSSLRCAGALSLKRRARFLPENEVGQSGMSAVCTYGARLRAACGNARARCPPRLSRSGAPSRSRLGIGLVCAMRNPSVDIGSCRAWQGCFGSSSSCSLAVCSEADRTAAPPAVGAVPGGTGCRGTHGCTALHPAPCSDPDPDPGAAGRQSWTRWPWRRPARAAMARPRSRCTCRRCGPRCAGSCCRRRTAHRPLHLRMLGSWLRPPPTACRCISLSSGSVCCLGPSTRPPLLEERPRRNT